MHARVVVAVVCEIVGTIGCGPWVRTLRVSHTLSLHNVVSTQRLCRYLGVVLKDLTGLSFLKTWSTDGDDDNKKTPHTEKTLNFTKYRGVSRVIGAVTRATSKAVLRFGED